MLNNAIERCMKELGIPAASGWCPAEGRLKSQNSFKSEQKLDGTGCDTTCWDFCWVYNFFHRCLMARDDKKKCYINNPIAS